MNIFRYLQGIVRGTTQPHKLMQRGATPRPATNLQLDGFTPYSSASLVEQNCAVDSPTAQPTISQHGSAVGLSETPTGETPTPGPQSAYPVDGVAQAILSPTHSHTNAEDGCGDSWGGSQ